MGAAAYGGRRFKERTRVSGERPIGAARCKQQYSAASCLPPPRGALKNSPGGRATIVCVCGYGPFMCARVA